MTLLFDWLLEGTILAAIATVLVRLIPSRYAAQRHALLWLVLLGIALLPAATLLPAVAGQPEALDLAPPVSAHALVLPPLPAWTGSILLLLWTAAVLVALVRLLHGLATLRRIARAAHPIDPSIEAQMPHLRDTRRASRNASIVMSEAVSGACAVGYLRPRVLLARALVERLDVADLEAVALHEYAHLQRFDDWTRLAQRIVLAFVGLHPAIRWISRQIDIECEAACDRLAVDRMAAPARYARALARVGEIGIARRRGAPPLAPAALIPHASLHVRVVRVLQQTSLSRRSANAASLVAGIIVTTVAVVVAAMPSLVIPAPMEQSFAALVSNPVPAAYTITRLSQVALPADDHRRHDAGPSSRGAVAAGAGRTADPEDGRSEPRPASALPDRDAGAGITDGSAPVTDAAPAIPPLSSIALPQITAAGPTAPIGESDAADVAPGWSALGSTAAQAGVTAGGAASRTGTAIGRAFKKGGLAIARSF